MARRIFMIMIMIMMMLIIPMMIIMLTIKILFTINSRKKNYSVKTLFTIPFVLKKTLSFDQKKFI